MPFLQLCELWFPKGSCLDVMFDGLLIRYWLFFSYCEGWSSYEYGLTLSLRLNSIIDHETNVKGV